VVLHGCIEYVIPKEEIYGKDIEKGGHRVAFRLNFAPV
jgi:hypothetical protein